MAFYNNLDEDEDGNASGMNNSEAAPSGAAPVNLSNQSATVSATPSQVPVSAKPVSSGAAPGFQNYAKANQGKAQEGLNTSAANAVTNSGQAATSAINNATNAFGKKVDAGTLENRETAVQDSAQAVAAARTLNAGQAVDQSQQDRFKQVINAKYTGPESLRQSGLYNPAAQKVQTAQTNIDNSKTTTGREELLKNMYSQRGDYTSGLNKLDSALLNGSQAGIQNLQSAAEAQGNIAQNLDQAQIGSNNLSQNRTNEIKGIKESARKDFSAQKQAEEIATEDRLSKVVKDWNKLPEHFRNIIRNKDKTNQTVLSNTLNEFKASDEFKDLSKEKNSLEAEYKAATSGRGYAPLSDQQIAYAENGYNLAIAKLQAQQQDISARRSARGLDDSVKAPPVVEGVQRMYDRAQQTKKDANTIKRYNELAYKVSGDEINNKFNKDAIILNPFEAATLGVQSGEGLYNLGANAIKTGISDRAKLVSKDEQARQAALSAMAGLDQSNRLDTNLLYDNAEKAGTQSILDSLDLAGTRRGLNAAEKNFGRAADGADLTGVGSKKVSRGNAFGKKTKTYYSEVKGNAGDFLDQAGYNSKLGIDNSARGRAILDASLQSTKTSRNTDDGPSVIGGTAMGAGTGAALGATVGSVVPGVGTAIGAGVGALAGGAIGGITSSGTIDPLQYQGDILKELGLGAVYEPIQDARNMGAELAKQQGSYNPIFMAGDAIGGALGLGSLSSGVAGAVGGIDTGAMKQMGEAEAKQYAIDDLKRQYTDFLGSQGFNNRVAVASNTAVDSRQTALQQLLASLDKTNT